MSSVGRTLRTERQSQHRELAQIADELCIAVAYLAAIEADDLKSLPGTFFYKSFVTQYATALGLNPADLRKGIEALTTPTDRESDASTALPPQVAKRKHGPIRVPDPILVAANKLDLTGRSLGYSVAGLAAALLVCSTFYSWWNQRTDLPQAASRQTQIKTSTVSNVQSAPNPAAEPTIDVTTSTGEDGIRRVVLNLSATETTWLSITSDGKKIFEGKLAPSESKTLEGLEVARMKVGNAGGLDVRWNGKQIGPIGKSGQVKTVLFTPEMFEILTEAVPPRPPVESQFPETL